MAIDFPDSPSNGSTYTYQGITFTWIDLVPTGYWKVNSPGNIGLATTAEVNAGTDNAKYVTCNAMEGSKYALKAVSTTKLTFTANGNWTKPLNLLFIEVVLVGSGGGGGGATGTIVGGGGGGGGSAIVATIPAELLAAGATSVQIGAGGVGGFNGPGGNGNGSAFFGMTAPGGDGGGYATGVATGVSVGAGPGLGGNATVLGNGIAFQGSDGDYGMSLDAQGRGGFGGSSHTGKGGLGGINATAPSATGNGFGGGGGGGATTGTARAGADGDGGVLYIIEHYSA